MRQKLHEDDKRKRVNVLLSNNERELLKEKMDKYGYADLSSYLRDAGIYERLYLEDIDGKKRTRRQISTLKPAALVLLCHQLGELLQHF